mgnify:CR=1 FL=1
MAEAAEALAEVAPSAVMGYDSQGNPIISMNAAKAAAQKADDKIITEATNQIANIGDLAVADITEAAEKNVNTDAYDKATVGLTTAITAIGATLIALVPGINVAAAVLATIGTSFIAIGGTQLAKDVALDAEERKLAEKEASAIISGETGQKIYL